MSHKLKREVEILKNALNPVVNKEGAEIEQMLREYEQLSPEEKANQNSATLAWYKSVCLGTVNGEPVSTETLVDTLIKISREDENK